VRRLALGALLFLTLAANGLAQEFDAHISLDEGQPWIAHVSVRFRDAARMQELSFLDRYAGVKFSPLRVSDLKVTNKDGTTAACRASEAGRYVCPTGYSWFEYNLDLSMARGFTSMAHVSWVTASSGMLVLDDILPQPTGKMHVRLTLDVPARWRIITNEDRTDETEINIADAQRAMIFFGRDWSIYPVGVTQLRLATLGDIQVPGNTAAADVAAIYHEYVRLFGSPSAGPFPQVVLVRPENSSGGSWDAETRGTTATIVTSGGLSPADSEQRLKQQLRHELFHLWLPNGVNLSGNYDWFYEGFAVYEASKLGVAMNQIRFEDLLSTIARANDIDRFTTKRSLIDASQNRWAGASSQVYARGMLVAFLCDIELLDASKGKTSVKSLLRQIFDEHRSQAAALNGNDAIISKLRSHPELIPIVDDYVTGSKAIDLTAILQKIGIQATIRDQLTQLAVSDKLSGRQKALLDKLGYNNWLKLAPK
jgi:predicted metalloprotease with PDZ domain